MTSSTGGDTPLTPDPLPALARNRYFKGKLLTVGDFKIEQLYNFEKLALNDRLVIGPGILCGLEVERVDGSLCIGAGAALDGLGRVLVVPKDVPISGDDLGKETADLDRNISVERYLCLEYEEEPAGPVTALTTAEGCQEGCDYGRINEGAKWKLCETPPAATSMTVSRGDLIFDNGQFRIHRFAPRWVHPGDVFEVRLVATFVAKSNAPEVTVIETMSGNLTGIGAPNLTLTVPTHETPVTYVAYQIRAGNQVDEQNSSISGKVDKIYQENIVTPADSAIGITDARILDKLVEDYGRRSGRDCKTDPDDASVCLARLLLQTSSDQKVSINDVVPAAGTPQLVHLPFVIDALAGLDSRAQGSQVAVTSHVTDGADQRVTASLATLRIADGLAAAGAASDTANVYASIGDGVQIDAGGRIAVHPGSGLKIDTSVSQTTGSDPVPQTTHMVAVNAGTGLKFGMDGQLQVDFDTSTAPNKAVEANDARLVDKRDPKPHASTHQSGGTDKIDVTGLSGVLADAQKVNVQENGVPKGITATLNFTGAVTVTAPAAPPAASDVIEINVAVAAIAPRVTSVDWKNNSNLSFAEFNDGLVVKFSAPMQDYGRHGFRVLLEVSGPNNLWTQRVQLSRAEDVKVKDRGKTWTWKPTNQQIDALKAADLLPANCWVVLQSALFRSQDTDLALDGEPRFKDPVKADEFDDPTLGAGHAVSGDGVSGGDFVSWFRLQKPV
jgi:hypothetical protein